jgi:uncharacterized protein DUF4288
LVGLVPGKPLERNEMADSPDTPRWYIAELVEELILGGNVRNVIHRKTRVIFADTHDDAYEKALSLSTEHEITYLNQKHESSQTRFWGLSELNLVKQAPEISTLERPGHVRPHFRQSDKLTPQQIMALMAIPVSPLPN